jgi:UDP-N-acetylmuramate dehydrogenase
MKLHKHFSLRALNTFGMDVKANWLAEIVTVEDIRHVLRDPDLQHLERLVLGGGSNILFTRPVQGIVLHNRIGGIEMVREDDDFAWIRAGAGGSWHELVEWAVERSLGGIENLSLIPGSVGAGPMQNIGAYGVELKDVFDNLEALHLGTMDMHTFRNSDCAFGYRESVFKHALKNQFFITAVTLRLSKKPVVNTAYGAIAQQLERMGVAIPGIREVSRAVMQIRRSKLPDPAVLGNAGSFFKNPEVEPAVFERLSSLHPGIVAYPLPSGMVKLAAGWLIEQCGWKGRVVGHTGAHKDQALVLVNYGHASGTEIYELALQIRNSVHERFGVLIDPEVNVY